MEKILRMILTLLMCTAILAGCGSNGNTSNGNVSNSSNQSDTTDPSTPADSDTTQTPTGEGVKITGNYTFEDPADLEFDTRYVLYMGPTSEMVSVSADKGQIAQYTIIYAKEDRAMAEYTLYVCDSAESAAAMLSEMEGYGMPVDLVAEDNTVIWSFSDEYVLEANIGIYQMAEMISETTASAYAQMYVTAYAAEMQEPAN